MAVKDRIMIEIGKLQDYGNEYQRPFATTLAGIAETLGIKTSYVSTEICKLEKNGLVYHTVVHTERPSRSRRHSYRLTPEGMALLPELNARYASANTPEMDFSRMMQEDAVCAPEA